MLFTISLRGQGLDGKMDDSGIAVRRREIERTKSSIACTLGSAKCQEECHAGYAMGGRGQTFDQSARSKMLLTNLLNAQSLITLGPVPSGAQQGGCDFRSRHFQPSFLIILVALEGRSIVFRVRSDRSAAG